MPSQDPILTISVAAKLLKLHPRTLMLYEKAELVLPHRTDTQRRLYSIKDLNQLQFVKFLTQTQGVNLQGVKFLLRAIKAAEEKGIKLRKQLFPDFKLKKLI